ncbi:TPA: type 1 glutamine amidotransferase [Enterobacter asburiae]|jgi:GMP synthase (glutamine-hydrolysing)|uniref:type 1 glutamine amidotransferase n=1 Tax=Enterobacter TaxID=547 RepID=UPI000845E576|nr:MULTISPECIES: type 1 glutamine amidotransferase [Enterobacter]SHH69518.1 GMP synthase (glutamine-hydrolysing) [Pantoea sesami]AOL12593.1 glutamine amidotransferase [Enterobacter sp. HK169]MBL5948030.1 type 1 glutamine amidotransferase [Enterobacter asburiae]MBS0844252.1 type 1 glutamine amidotransferase [Enterobacter asburiae]TDV79591.1 GMP synthase (glutamine-hydrolysing) [Enterobacter asburiae]
MHIHFIIHEHFEAPGAYEVWGKNRGCSMSYSRVYQGDPLPEDLQSTDLLIIMGGPQSPATALEECPWFDAQAEKALISRAIEAGKTVIGVCLGSQLIGEALGAAFCHSPEKEIGTFPVRLTEAGKANPLFEDFGHELNVGHWHNDMPGLTPQAKVLAYSEGCPRQIVQYGERIYGFQCHMELTPEVVELLIEHSQNDLRRAAEFRFVETAEKLRSHDYREMNQVLFSFLDKLAAQREA